MRHISDLFFFIVATKTIRGIFLFYLVGAHLKNFARARPPEKFCLKRQNKKIIKSKIYLIFKQFFRGVRVRARKLLQVRANKIKNKTSVIFFCCYDKKKQIRKFSQDFSGPPRWCTQKFFTRIVFQTNIWRSYKFFKIISVTTY